MKISLEWLTDFLPTGPNSKPLDSQTAADALTHAGLPVESFETHGSDQVLDVEVTSNRSDCLSHVGVARELSALLTLPFREPSHSAPESNEPITDAVRVRIDATQLCPHYTARLIRGVKIGPSPAWMIRRLEAIGLRPVNNVVDVTNYVMFEMGQPLHAFDFSKIAEGQIIVREAKRGESLVSIDGRKRDLTPGMLVIADTSGPVALAGVMGGIHTEVSEKTVDVLLESARFDPLTVRRAARALAMKSDSSYRFERGIDPTLPLRASLRATQLILETAGGQLARGIVQAGADGYQLRAITLRLPQLRRILGVELPVDEVLAAFKRLSLQPQLQEDRIAVTAPSHRLDINVEIDLVEEAARVLGYSRIPTREEIEIRLTPPEPDSITVDSICQTLVAGGYFEAVTFSFVSDQMRNDFGASAFRADPSVRKADAALRPSLIPGLLEAVRLNETNGNAGAKLFEVGAMFPTTNAASGATAGVRLDERRAVTCVGGDLRQVRGIVETLLGRLDADRPVKVIPEARAGFAKGAGGRVMWGDEPVGYLGKIDRAVGEKLSLRSIPAAAELELNPLLLGRRGVKLLKDLPKFPAVRRDISLVVPETLPYEKIDSLVRNLTLPFLEGIDYVTTYRGKPLEAGTKSVTLTLVFRSPTTTLLSEEVETSVQKTVAAAGSQLGAVLRT